MRCAYCGDRRGPLGPDDKLPACEDAVACDDRIRWARAVGVIPPCDLPAGLSRHVTAEDFGYSLPEVAIIERIIFRHAESGERYEYVPVQ